MRLAISDIKRDARFQVRAHGTDAANVRAIKRTLEAGQDIEPVKVARVGRGRYLVDGWHRLEALESTGETHVDAVVARMDEREAVLCSLTANASHGKQLSRADKNAALVTFVEHGAHLDAHGTPKSSRDIRDELRGIYSHSTIWSKLKAMGHEIPEDVEYPDGYKPHPFGINDGDEGDDFDDDLGGALDPLEGERDLEALGHIEALWSLLPTLSDAHQGQALKALRGLVEALESGVWPVVVEGGGLDI
jgi:hypothetical protein